MPMSRFPDLDRMRAFNYQAGKDFLEENPFMGPLVKRLESDCPHLDRRDIVALFHLRNEELVAAAAHRLEYNATHPPEGSGPPR